MEKSAQKEFDRADIVRDVRLRVDQALLDNSQVCCGDCDALTIFV
jgi:hypothetical protein